MGAYLATSEPLGFVDKRRARGSAASVMGTPASYASDATLEARLLAIGGYYTQARINQMTFWDKVFAVRTNDDAAGIR